MKWCGSYLEWCRRAGVGVRRWGLGLGWGEGGDSHGRFLRESIHGFCDRTISMVGVWVIPIKTYIGLQFLRAARLGNGTLRRDYYLSWGTGFSLLRAGCKTGQLLHHPQTPAQVCSSLSPTLSPRGTTLHVTMQERFVLGRVWNVSGL